jgi:hypothetical protein
VLPNESIARPIRFNAASTAARRVPQTPRWPSRLLAPNARISARRFSNASISASLEACPSCPIRHRRVGLRTHKPASSRRRRWRTGETDGSAGEPPGSSRLSSRVQHPFAAVVGRAIGRASSALGSSFSGSAKASSIACLAISRRSSRDSPIGGSSGSPAIGCVGLPQPRSRIEFAAETRAASLLPDVAILTSVSIATRLCSRARSRISMKTFGLPLGLPL